MSTYLIINEQHSLFEEQRELLRGYGKVKFVNIPSAGLTRDEMDDFEAEQCLGSGDIVIFASPIPYLLKKLASSLLYWNDNCKLKYDVRVFHNDTRDKKELPNGKIIQTVSAVGWEIL